MVQPHFPIVSLRLNSNVVLALPHHPIMIRRCKEFQSRIPGLEGEAWILTLMSGIRRLSLIFSSPVHSYRRRRKTLKLTAIVSPVVKIYFVLSYHFSNLARLALEPLTKRFTLLLTVYLGQMIRYGSDDGTKDLVLLGSQVVIRISLGKMTLRFRLFGIL